jgi:hypothetical protein
MSKQLKIEIASKDDFWRNAVSIEWSSRYPQRQLAAIGGGIYSIDMRWLNDLQDVAVECNSTIVVAPSDPGRRLLFTQFLPQRLSSEQ